MITDPILYPLARGNADSVRQDIFRARAELSDTLAALAGRTHVLRRLRVGAVEAPRTRGVVVASAAVVGTVAVAAGGHRLAHRGGFRGVGQMAVGVVALSGAAFVATRLRRPPGGTPMRSAHGVPLSVDVDTSVPLVPTRIGGDVVDLLMRQHRQIHASFVRVAAAERRFKLEAFASLVDLVKGHENGEQEVVHSTLRNISPLGARVVDERMAEEKIAERNLADLISMGVFDRRFDKKLAALHALVRAHAEREERDEFPLLRREIPPEQLRRMASELRATRGELP